MLHSFQKKLTKLKIVNTETTNILAEHSTPYPINTQKLLYIIYSTVSNLFFISTKY